MLQPRTEQFDEFLSKLRVVAQVFHDVLDMTEDIICSFSVVYAEVEVEVEF